MKRSPRELGSRLRAVAPVYLAATKFDLVVGFEEFIFFLDVGECSHALRIWLRGLDINPCGDSLKLFDALF